MPTRSPLRPASFYSEHDIDLQLNQKAMKLDRGAKTVHTESGGVVGYDRLILATGARAKPLAVPGADLDGVMYLRNSVDAEMLKRSLGKGKRLAVIGGGYIGLEAAASARGLGVEAVVIEVMPRVLARVACEQLSTFVQDYHRARGVTFELDVAVTGFEGDDGRVTGVHLADERVIPCDAMLGSSYCGLSASVRHHRFDIVVEFGDLVNDKDVVHLLDGHLCHAYSLPRIRWRA